MEEKVWVYNRSGREHQIPVGADENGFPLETVIIPAGQSRQLPKDVAEKFMKRYHKDFIYGQSKESDMKLRTQLKKLKEENDALTKQNFELVKEIEELKKHIGTEKPRRGRPQKEDKGEGLDG